MLSLLSLLVVEDGNVVMQVLLEVAHRRCRVGNGTKQLMGVPLGCHEAPCATTDTEAADGETTNTAIRDGSRSSMGRLCGGRHWRVLPLLRWRGIPILLLLSYDVVVIVNSMLWEKLIV